MAWNPTVEARVHPFGEQGVRSSLEETAKAAVKALQGEHLVRVRTWAIEKLDDARKRGESVATAEGRARVLLHAVQQKLWVPDPIGIEYIPAGHMMACDKHGPNGEVCVAGDDCDGHVGLLAACYMAVGLYCMVAGHAYDQSKNIVHVLVRVYFNGKWHYADPSALPRDFSFRGRQLKAGDHFDFGECAPYTRERCYSVPEIRVICDGDTCRRNFNPENEGFVKKGNFVGLSGVDHLVVEEMPPVFRWLDEESTLGVAFGAEQPIVLEQKLEGAVFSAAPKLEVSAVKLEGKPGSLFVLKHVRARCDQQLAAIRYISSGKIFIQPVEMHPQGVPRCDSLYTVGFYVDGDVTEIIQCSDSYGGPSECKTIWALDWTHSEFTGRSTAPYDQGNTGGVPGGVPAPGECADGSGLRLPMTPFAWLSGVGQVGPATELTAQQTTQRVSNIEKLMFAGVMISGISLATHIWELQKRHKREEEQR